MRGGPRCQRLRDLRGTRIVDCGCLDGSQSALRCEVVAQLPYESRNIRPTALAQLGIHQTAFELGARSIDNSEADLKGAYPWTKWRRRCMPWGVIAAFNGAAAA